MAVAAPILVGALIENLNRHVAFAMCAESHAVIVTTLQRDVWRTPPLDRSGPGAEPVAVRA